MKGSFFLIVISFIFLLNSCSKDNDVPEPTTNFVVKFIGHRGSGSDDFYGKDSSFPRENTFASMLIGFQYLHGSETDIQMSLDGTLWLWHDATFPDNNSSLSIPTMHDAEIIALQLPDKPVAKLDSVFYWMSRYAVNKIISLDIKGYFPMAPTLDLYAYYDRMSDSIRTKVRRYHLQRRVFVETDYTIFLDYMKFKEPLVDRYLLAYSDLRTAVNTCIDRGYTGVSFAYYDTSMTEQNMRYLRSKGLKIQVWTLHTLESIEYIERLKPDVIQTDVIKEIHVR
jgi:glycerophosphoryl diester phosphodiesterase